MDTSSKDKQGRVKHKKISYVENRKYRKVSGSPFVLAPVSARKLIWSLCYDTL